MSARIQSAPVKTRDVGTRINVVVRVRPPNQREISSQQGNVIHVLDDRVLIFDPPGERVRNGKFMQSSQARAKNLHFGFDKVLSPECTQDDVFEEVKNTVFSERGGLLDGFNCTVFAYGATGSGKTFSMAGTPENPGLMSRAVQYIYSALDQMGRKAKLRLSYLEIYNEQIRDLLNPDDSSKELKIVEDAEKGIVVTGLSHCYPTNTDEVLQLISIGNNRRTQAQTESNPVSSRSHAVCQIEVENCEDMPDIQSNHPIGKLSLIDLAGSERATSNTGIRLKESAKINCSLLALSNCINALCTQNSFIPFRQSKLTRLLKDSLGGNCKTVCLSCVSPSYMTYDDTYSTLQYANKTKNIRTNVTRNTLNVKAQVSQYPKIIAELRAQIQQLQSQGGNNSQADAFAKALEEPFNKEKREISQLINREVSNMPGNDVKQQILALQRMTNSDIRRKLSLKIAAFTTECLRRKPTTSSKAIDLEQRLKTLELENLALVGQLELADKQITLQQNVIRCLSQKQQTKSSASSNSTIAASTISSVSQQETTVFSSIMTAKPDPVQLPCESKQEDVEPLIQIPPLHIQPSTYSHKYDIEIVDLTEPKRENVIESKMEIRSENIDPNKDDALISILDDTDFDSIKHCNIQAQQQQNPKPQISFAPQHQQQQQQPVSARRVLENRVSITDMSRIRNSQQNNNSSLSNNLNNNNMNNLSSNINSQDYANHNSDQPVSRISRQEDLSRILRQKFAEAEQIDARRPLAERSGNGLSSGFSKGGAPPYRSLMDQLSQRVAANNMNLSEETTSILLRSRMLTQNGKR